MNLENMTDAEKMAALESIHQSIAASKEIQKEKLAANVDLVVQALKKIESDIRERFDSVGNAIEKRVLTIQDGRDGIDGTDGRNGKDGRDGKLGVPGQRGVDGKNGQDGIDGQDGVSVRGAKIDFDGSLVITLSNGNELNVGEVVAPSLAESIKVITNGGGTSQTVIDTLASLQEQINNIYPSQTGNSGKFLTTNGSAVSWGAVTSTGTGTVTSVAVSGGSTGLTTSGGPITTSGTITLAGTLAVANGGTGVTTSTGTGNTVLSNTPTLVSPVLNTGVSGSAIDTSTTLAANSDTLLPSQRAVKTYVDGVAQGLSIKESVQLATIAALPSNIYNNGTSGVGATLTGVATGVLTVDGVAVALNNRVLVKDEAAPANNGIYLCTLAGAVGVAYVLTRSVNCDQPTDIPGAFTFVELGAINFGAGFVVASAGPFTVGTTAISWTQFSGAGQITAGAGLTKTGNTIDAVGTTNRIVVAADSIDIGTDVVTLTGSQTLTNKSIVAMQLTGTLQAAQFPALTGDITTVAGALASTLATVATAGTTGSSTAIPVVTINAKGLTTSITTAAVIAPAGTLTGSTLAAGVTASSITSVGSGIALGTPSSGVVTNLTGTASININGTVGATTPTTVVGTTGSFSGNLSFNSGYGSSAVAYGCRAWVNFNGTGTVAIRASGNVSSITDNGVGDYTVNFTTAMVDANYSVSVDKGVSANRRVIASYGVDASSNVVTPTTTAVRIICFDESTSATADMGGVSVSIFR